MKYYLNNKKVSKKTLEGKFGKENVNDRIKSAIEDWREDPYICMEWMDGMRIDNELQ